LTLDHNHSKISNMPAPSETRNYPLPELERVSKPVVTCSILKQEPGKAHHSFSNDVIAVVDGIVIMRESDRVFNTFFAASGTFIAAGGASIVIAEVLKEQIPTPLMILTAVSGVTVAFMSVRLYLKDKIDRI